MYRNILRCEHTVIFVFCGGRSLLSWVWIFIHGAELTDQSQRRRTMDHGCWKSWVFSRRLKVLSDSSRRCVAKEVDCSRLRGRTPRSSAGQWKSELWAWEEFQSSQSVVDALPRLKWPECTDRQGSAALYRVDIFTRTRTAVLKVMRWRIGSQWSSVVAPYVVLSNCVFVSVWLLAR